MLNYPLAIWLNVFTIAIITSMIANLTISVVVSLLAQKFLNLQVSARKWALWFLVSLPWVIGVITVVYYLNVVGSYDDYLLASFYTHWHHMTTFTWLSWHGITLISVLSLIVFILGTRVNQLIKHRREIRTIAQFSTARDDGVYVLDLSEPSAFTAGIINKKCFVTTGMKRNISDEELDIVLAHEKAHAKNNDPFKKWCFGILASFFIPPLANRLKLHMALAMEQDADDSVVKVGTEKTLIASTLVKVARMNAQNGPLKQQEMVVNFGADVLEQRVYFLLGELRLKPLSKIGILLFFALVVTISGISVDGVHHLVETIFSH